MSAEILNVDLTLTTSDSEADAIKKAATAVDRLYGELIGGMGIDPCAARGALASLLVMDMHPGCAMKMLQMLTVATVARAGAAMEAQNEVKH